MRLVHGLLASALLSACTSSAGAPSYPQVVLHEDVSAALETLEEAYGPKALIAPVAWQRMRRHLERLDVSSADREHFCDVMGNALTEFRDPGLFVTLTSDDDVSARCHTADAQGHIEGLPGEGTQTSENIATDGLYEVRREGETTLIGIRHFAPRDDAGWEGLPVFDVRSAAILLDLRGAGGTDPRAVLDRLWGITQGRQIGFPFSRIARAEGPIAESARERASVEGRHMRRDPDVWNELVGPPRISVPPQPQPVVAVLIDAGCEEACQVVARVLEVWAGADVVGTLSTRAPVSRDEPGIVILPETGIALHFPTSAYVFNRSFVNQGAAWRTRPEPSPAADESLVGVLRALNYRVSTSQRLEEFAAELPACADSPTYADRAALPLAARERLFGEFDDSAEQSVTVTMDLPEAAAREWLASCPGIVLEESSAEPDGSSIFHLQRRPSFLVLSRILGNAATRAVTIHSQPIVE